MYQISTILEAYKKIDESVIELTTEKVKQEISEKYPEIDLSDENNIDFIVRPIVSILLFSEIEKNNIQSLSSLDGIINSSLSDDDKYSALLKYAYNTGLTPISKDWKSLYQEIIYFIRNNWFNFKTPVINKIISSIENLCKIYISDSNSNEMYRNRIPIVQFPDTLVNNFVKNDTNQLNILTNSFSRSDVEKYLFTINNGEVKLPNFIDIYLLSDVVTEEITVSKNTKGMYTLPSKYYIDVTHSSKEISIDNTSIDFMYGIINRSLDIFIVDGEDTETVIVRYFNISNEPNIEDVINTSNVLYKGFFPVFADLTIYTEQAIDDEKNQLIFNEIKEYNKSKNFSLNINIMDINKIIQKYYIDGICSPTVNSTVFLSPGIKYNKTVVFPITSSDLKTDINFPMIQLSENTLSLFINDIRVTNEN